jgi:PIN domain nuclease of toxin-antitoxin system
MRLLLDTATLIYAVQFPERLSRRASSLLQDLDNVLELSAISVTEIAIKAASGKLAFAIMPSACLSCRFTTATFSTVKLSLRRYRNKSQP